MNQNKNTPAAASLSLSDPVRVLSDCALCPRDCHVNRLQGQRGFCGESGVLRAARAALYYTEEPVISGRNGSGTVFFSGCNLGCIYCQNRQISRPGRDLPAAAPVFFGGTPGFPDESGNENGKKTAGEPRLPRLIELSPERLSDIFFELEAEGAHNINLVTPEHFVPLLVPALDRAKRQGLTIPVVYNTGSYEKVEAVKALEGLVDVWLPDLKYVSSILSARHTGAADYFSCASAAIAEMVRQCPEPVFSDGSHTIDCPDDADDPLMIRGVLVRHLALPGCGQDSRAVLRYLHETYGDRIFISIMNQYTPMPQVLKGQTSQAEAIRSYSSPDVHGSDDSRGINTPGDQHDLQDLCRCLSPEEYDDLINYAIEIGIENGFIQEEGTTSYSYIPDFDGTGIR